MAKRSKNVDSPGGPGDQYSRYSRYSRDSTESRDFRGYRVLVVSPFDGGSLPISRHVSEAFVELGAELRFADFSGLLDSGNLHVLSDPDHRSLAVTYASDLLIAQARAFRPDLCFVLAQAPVNEKALDELHRLGTTTAFWFVENYRLTRYWTWLAPLYDWFFTIQQGPFHEELDALGGVRSAWLPLGCNPTRHRRVELSEAERSRYHATLSFAGYGYYNRRTFFTGLSDQDLKIWGPGFEGTSVARFVQADSYDEQDWTRIASGGDIHINLHSASHISGVDPDGDYLNPRVFELASFGAFQLCDLRSQLNGLFETTNATEIPVFENLRELRDRIREFGGRPEERKDIAERARRRAHAEHTYRHRMERVLELIGDSPRTGRNEETAESGANESTKRLSQLSRLSQRWDHFGHQSELSREEILFRLSMHPEAPPAP